MIGVAPSFRLAASLGCLLHLVALPLAAQNSGRAPGEPRLRATGHVRWTIHDNYFQMPAGRPDSSVQATSVSVRLVGDAVRRLGAQLYVEGRITAFDAFDPTLGGDAGVRLGPRLLRVEVGGGYDRRLPRLDLGDALARADVARLHSAVSLRLDRVLELTGEGRATWQALVFADQESYAGDPDPREEWESFTYLETELSARTRLLGRWFSPEVGVGFGRPWNEEQSIFTYDQNQWHVQVRSVPISPVYVSVRYRVRERDYPRAPEGSSSFGRRDRREQLAVGFDLRVAGRLGWNVYFTQEHAHSSLSSRSFRTRAVTLGVTLAEG